jgi:hypothetical protein
MRCIIFLTIHRHHHLILRFFQDASTVDARDNVDRCVFALYLF